MRRLPAATIALACALTLAGCSDDGREPADSQSTWTPTATQKSPESPSMSAVSDPAVAPENETARQFIRRWVELGNQMQATGDTAAFLAVAGPDCKSCHDFADRISKIYASGGSVTGGASTLVKATHLGGDEWTVRVRGAPSRVTARVGGRSERLPGGPYELTMYIARVDGRWIVGYYEDAA